MEQLLEESIFGKLPYQKEEQIIIEVFDLGTEIYGRIFLAPIIFEKEKVKEMILSAKQKLEEMM